MRSADVFPTHGLFSELSHSDLQRPNALSNKGLSITLATQSTNPAEGARSIRVQAP
jgi:hypothetical protein